MAEECMAIADEEDDANKGKLRVWTRLQLLKCWNPKKYGERVNVDANVQVNRVVSDI